MTEQTPPYYVETRTKQIAALGIELAQLHRHRNDRVMTIEEIEKVSHKFESVVSEILKLAEEGKPSNE